MCRAKNGHSASTQTSGKYYQYTTDTHHKAPTYDLGNHGGLYINLERESNETDIGVTINNQYTFEKHIQNQVKKANQSIGVIRRGFTRLDIKISELLFKAIVGPQLEYVSSVYRP